LGTQHKIQQEKWPPSSLWIIVVICVIIIVALLIATILVLKTQGLNQGSLILVIIFGLGALVAAISGAMFAYFQWAYPKPVGDTKLPTDNTSDNSVIGNLSLAAHSSSTANATQPANASQIPSTDILISYTDADFNNAEWIAIQLEQAGYSVAFRSWDIGPGSNFIQEMNEATREAKRTMVVLSPDYLKSFEHHPEWAVAFNLDPTSKQRRVLPVYVRKVNPQLMGLLGPIVPIDLVGRDKSEARELLIKGVNFKPRERMRPPAFPGQSQNEHQL
jgi:hypothetical protein